MFFRIQKSIILGQSGQLLAQLAKEARLSYNMGRPLHAHKQRFLAHLVLFLRLKSQNVPKEDGDYFVKSYTDYLISEKMVWRTFFFSSQVLNRLETDNYCIRVSFIVWHCSTLCLIPAKRTSSGDMFFFPQKYAGNIP